MADYATKQCSKCGRTLKDTNFYQLRDGSKTDKCKACLTMHVDNYDPETFKWILQILDVPYIPTEWNTLRDRNYAKNPDKVTGSTILGKYIGKMRLSQWNKYRWSDTETLIREQEQKEQEQKKQAEARMEELRAALARGDISQSEYDAYVNAEELQKEKRDGSAPPSSSVVRDPVSGKVISGGESAEKSEDDRLLDSLTAEDKIMLSTKWGKLYTASEWIALEKNYIEMTKSFDIQDQDTKNTLILLCKANLKMNQAIDQGDYEGASKFSRMYDSLRKSANFMAVQNKEDKTDAFDSIGELVAFCEKHKGAIPKYDISTPLDVVDKVIADMKEYTENLIKSDMSLAAQIENYIQQRKRIDEIKFKKMILGKANMDEDLSPEDYLDYLDQQDNLKEQDYKILTESEDEEE